MKVGIFVGLILILTWYLFDLEWKYLGYSCLIIFLLSIAYDWQKEKNRSKDKK